MDEKQVGFFTEDNGNRSMMRVMCVMSFMAALVFGYMAATARDMSSPAVFVFSMFLLGAFAPKALQKMLEQKVEK